MDNRLIRSIFTASDSEVFICDSDLRWLLKNNLLKVIKTELESRENFHIYLMLYSPENPIFRSPSLRENTQKIQIILNSMRKLLNFSKKNSGISERIHIRLNTTEPLLLNGFTVARRTALWESLVGKPGGKASWESLEGKPQIP